MVLGRKEYDVVCMWKDDCVVYLLLIIHFCIETITPDISFYAH